jgi:hypothetical protein
MRHNQITSSSLGFQSLLQCIFSLFYKKADLEVSYQGLKQLRMKHNEKNLTLYQVKIFPVIKMNSTVQTNNNVFKYRLEILSKD